MKNEKISSSDLMAIGYVQGPALGEALRIAEGSSAEKSAILESLAAILNSPENYLQDTDLAGIAELLLPKEDNTIQLNEKAIEYAVYGSENIEQGAHDQMEVAMRLPVTVAGALMPDAHQGYGLPIGGVLATRNAIIPYGVGVDIGCRMALSIYDMPEEYFYENHAKFKRELIAHTKFGAGHGYHGQYRNQHEVLDSTDFNLTPFLANLKNKAFEQLGTSGGGNHFVEWGIIEVEKDDEKLNLKKGKYVALLTHSGSRGFGATVAGHYTKLAKELCKLPKEAANLAYLDMNSEVGQEYWIAMNLAGDYASACHEVIHQKLSKAIGGELIARVENHHNFAWKEIINGEELIIHRKGATPASEDVLGIIPGSMTAPGFLVRGKGEQNALNSASHGAGRKMSRTQATKSTNRNELSQILKEHNVTLIGAGLDEAPIAYKDINAVMAAQEDLVDVIAKFTPKMVRMADDGSRED